MVVTSKKSATMTFRIDEDVLNKLRAESENRETNLNTFVNQSKVKSIKITLNATPQIDITN